MTNNGGNVAEEIEKAFQLRGVKLIDDFDMFRGVNKMTMEEFARYFYRAGALFMLEHMKQKDNAKLHAKNE